LAFARLIARKRLQKRKIAGKLSRKIFRKLTVETCHFANYLA
jgi:hypothetical protein